MKDKVLAGGLVDACKTPCEHRYCNDLLLRSLLISNPFEHENNKENSVAPVLRAGVEADNRSR
jgi:hypothetical protein